MFRGPGSHIQITYEILSGALYVNAKHPWMSLGRALGLSNQTSVMFFHNHLSGAMEIYITSWSLGKKAMWRRFFFFCRNQTAIIHKCLHFNIYVMYFIHKKDLVLIWCFQLSVRVQYSQHSVKCETDIFQSVNGYWYWVKTWEKTCF